MKNKEVILYEDEKSARFVENIKGWVDINNRFWGDKPDSEHMARYSSCTHRRCECGNITPKGRIRCDSCRAKTDIERYNALPFQTWDGEGFLYSDMADKYFRDSDEIEDYLADNELEPKELRLLLCVPNEFREIDGDYWEDILPEDSEGELPKKLQDALSAFNEVIKSLPPASYSPSKIRTSYDPR